MGRDAAYDLNRVIQYIDRLEEAHIWYRIEHIRSETIMVEAVVPGEHWEIEFFGSGDVAIEKFISAGVVNDDASLLEELIVQH